MTTTVLACLLWLCAVPAHAAERVPYPEGYRAWHHVKRMVINPGHPLYEAFGGIHHIYANAKALAGYRDGKYADGAMIVFDLLEAETGGWGFEAFKGDSKSERAVGADAASACFVCHTSQKSNDYVFSPLRR